jgi:hypothetical protein
MNLICDNAKLKLEIEGRARRSPPAWLLSFTLALAIYKVHIANKQSKNPTSPASSY